MRIAGAPWFALPFLAWCCATPAAGSSRLQQVPTVPNLQWMSFTEVRKLVPRLHFNLVADQDCRPITAYPLQVRVTSQSPAPGTPARRGDTIHVACRQAPDSVVTPSVIDSTIAGAERVIRAAGLTLSQVDTLRQPWTVRRQRPPPGAVVPAGAKVTLVIGRTNVMVPAVTGLPVAAARMRLADSGLVLGDIARTDGPGPPGIVQEQRPAAGTSVDPESPVQLAVFSGWVRVPDLTGSRVQDGRAQLARAGLRLGQVGSTPVQAPEGRIAEQRPPAAARVRYQARVDVFLPAAVPESVSVPDLAGLTRDEAERLLGEGFLLLGVVDSAASDRPAGTVVAQSVPPLTLVARQTPVDITVARITGIPVPDVRGRRLAEAASVLAGAGLHPGHVDSMALDSLGGTVGAQGPPPLTLVPPGSPVDLVLCCVVLVVPPVVGLSPGDALTRLTDAGLKRGIDRTTRTLRVTSEVVAQRPEAGTVVPPGTVVHVDVDAPSPMLPIAAGLAAFELIRRWRRRKGPDPGAVRFEPHPDPGQADAEPEEGELPGPHLRLSPHMAAGECSVEVLDNLPLTKEVSDG